MENKTINLKAVAQVAAGLEELLPEMVFVGGAVISLYADDPAADEIRPTGDIDITVKLAGFAEWAAMQERLLALGFSPDPHGHAICSYLYKGISVDIMPADDGPLGNANRWYAPGFAHLKETEAEGQAIQILSSPFFMATKFEAFNDRGKDYRTSHDFEDIIYVLDNKTDIVDEILGAEEEVKTYLITELRKVWDNRNRNEILQMHLHPLIAEGRFPILLEKLERIVLNVMTKGTD